MSGLRFILTAGSVFAVIFSCSDFPEIPYEARLSEISSSDISSGSEVSSSSSEISSSSEASSSSEISSSSEASSSSEIQSSSSILSSSSYLDRTILIEDFENESQLAGQWFTIGKPISFSDINYRKPYNDKAGFFLEFKEFSYLRFNNAGQFMEHSFRNCHGLRYSYKGTEHIFIINVSNLGENMFFYKMFDESLDEWVTVTMQFDDLIRYDRNLEADIEQPIHPGEIENISKFNWDLYDFLNDNLLAIDDIYCLAGN